MTQTRTFSQRDTGDRIVQIEDYERFVGGEVVDRIRRKAKTFRDYHIAHVNSTYYGGGVAQLLSSLSLLMNSLGIKTGWRVILGTPDFFSVTKKMHNALQGSKIRLTEKKMQIYEQVILENAVRTHLDHDIVIVHDPQPLPMIDHYRKKGPWLWRCHVDLTEPDRQLWNYLTSFVEKYDAVIFSLEDYRQALKTPQRFFPPAIDPFSITNRDLRDEEIDDRLRRYEIPMDLPLVVQVSRFDQWKDPKGVIEAFKMARKEVDATLVLLGNVATDDPEGESVFESLLKEQDNRILIRSHQDAALVNALQRRAEVVLQKSIREGFGFTATEAMWKGTPVVARNAGGLRYQIEDGRNGFLVSSTEDAARRIVQVLKDESLRRRIGEEAKKTVQDHFLLTRYLENYLDLLASFRTNFTLGN